MKNLEWVFKLNDQVSPAAKEIAKNLDGLKKVLDNIASSTALPGLEKTAKALGGMARGFASLQNAGSAAANIRQIGNELPDLAIAAGLTNKEITELGQAIGRMDGNRLKGFVEQLPVLARQLNSFKINTNAITGLSMFSKSIGLLGSATNRLNPSKIADFRNALNGLLPLLNGLRVNPNAITGISLLATGLYKLSGAVRSMGSYGGAAASAVSLLNNIRLDGFRQELDLLVSRIAFALDTLKKFKTYMNSLARSLSKIAAADLAQMKDININVRQSGGGGGGGGGGGRGNGNDGNAGPGGRRRGRFGADLQFGNMVGFPAGALAAVGGALGNRAFSGLSLGGRLMSASGPLVGALTSLTAATIGLRNTILGIGEQERNIARMETLFGPELGRQGLQWAVDFAAKTPFELSGVISAISKLRGSAGLTDKQITPILQAMADLGAGTGMTSEKMASGMEQLVQSLGLGVVHLEELNIIAENGIPVWQALTKATGLSSATLREMISKNELAATSLSNALIDFANTEYFGAAARGAKTMSGMLDQLASRATTFNLLMALGPTKGQPDVLKNFKQTLSNILDLTDPNKEPGKTIFKNIQQTIGIIDDLLFGSLAKLTNPKTAGSTILKFMDDLKKSLQELKPFLDEVSLLVQKLAKAAQDMWPVLVTVADILQMVSDMYFDLPNGVRQTIVQIAAFAIAGNFLFGTLSSVWGILKGFWGTLVNVKNIVAGLPGKFQGFLAVLRGLPLLLTAGIGKLMQFMRVAFLLVATNPFTAVFAGVALILSILIPLIISNWEEIKQWGMDAWQSIVDLWQNSKLKAIVDNIRNFIDGMLFSLQQSGSNIGNSIMQGLMNGITAMFPPLKAVMGLMPQQMKDAWAISSPSKIAFGYGEYISQGLMNGMEKAYQAPNLAMASVGYAPSPSIPMFAGAGLAGSFPSRVTTPQQTMPFTPTPTMQNMNAMPPVSVSINVSGAMGDPKAIADEVRKVAVSAVLEALETAAVEAGQWQ